MFYACHEKHHDSSAMVLGNDVAMGRPMVFPWYHGTAHGKSVATTWQCHGTHVKQAHDILWRMHGVVGHSVGANVMATP